MTIGVYVITAAGAVTTHYDRVQAKAAVDAGLIDAIIVATSADLPKNGSEQLRDLHRRLVPEAAGGDETVTRTGLFDLINEKFKSQPFMEPTAMKDLSPAPAVEEAKEDTTMSEVQTADTAKPKAAKVKAPKKTTAVKAKTPRVGKGKPACKAADFGAVLKGSKRAGILELMTGKYDTKEIGAKLSIEPSLVSSNIFCLNRDIGVGYEYTPQGKINALFPAGKTIADALKAKTAPVAKVAKAKAPAAKAKAKKAA